MLTTPFGPRATHRDKWVLTDGGDPRAVARARQQRTTVANTPESAVRLCGCGGTGFLPPRSTDWAQEVARLRPAAAALIDQCHVDAVSLMNRISVLCAHTPLSEATVVFVGDDDLASVALLRHSPPRRLVVIDLDERILAAVADEADRLGLTDRLEVHHTDLTFLSNVDAVVEAVGPVADVAVTDPPYASHGMAAFVGLATRLTAFDGIVHIACPHVIAEAWSDELLYAIQRQLTDAGFVIERLVPGAFSYETSDVISSLVVARRLPGTTLSAPADVTGTGARFYTQRTPTSPVPATVFTNQGACDA